MGAIVPRAAGAGQPAVSTRDDADGRLLAEAREVLGGDEALLLAFWPFTTPDNRIPAGEQQLVHFRLPDGHGTAEVAIRYHDWRNAITLLHTLREDY